MLNNLESGMQTFFFNEILTSLKFIIMWRQKHSRAGKTNFPEETQNKTFYKTRICLNIWPQFEYFFFIMKDLPCNGALFWPKHHSKTHNANYIVVAKKASNCCLEIERGAAMFKASTVWAIALLFDLNCC